MKWRRSASRPSGEARRPFTPFSFVFSPPPYLPLPVPAALPYGQPRLPAEVVDMAPTYVTDKQTLATCCPVSHSFFRIARSILHSIAYWPELAIESDDFITCLPSQFPLLQPLVQHPHLIGLSRPRSFRISTVLNEYAAWTVGGLFASNARACSGASR
jgi:hypothetical protein